MSSTFLISVGIVLVCVGPFIYLSLNNKRKRNAVINRLNNSSSYKFKGDNCTIWGDSVMSIDVNGEVLGYQKDGQSAVSVFPLGTLLGCKVEVQRSGDTSVAVEKVELNLIYGKGKNEERIKLFDSAERLNINNELMIANQWKERLESAIKRH